MSRHSGRHGEGTAWLVADRISGDFHCYWYVGRAGDHLADKARAATADAAVDWGRARTPNVRIRTADGQSQWAGTAPRPPSHTATWASTRMAPDGVADLDEGAAARC